MDRSRTLNPYIVSFPRSLKVRRFILSEKSIASQPFGSEFPDVGEYLPVDSDRLDERPSTDAGASHRHQISALASQDIGNFGREVQAAYLYSCVQEAIYIKENLSDITQLKVLDSKLQSFFADITCQSGTTWGLYCGSISFVIAYAYNLVGHIDTDVWQRLI